MSIPGRTDWIVLLCQDAPAPVDVDLDARTVRLVGAATGDVITNIGKPGKLFIVYGTHGNDRIRGRNDSGPEQLYGLAGNDVISGRGGDDVLDGGEATTISTAATAVTVPTAERATTRARTPER